MKEKNCHNSRWDSPYHSLLENDIYVSKLHRAVLEKELNKTGVYRSQHQFLMYVSKNPNASQKEIADRYHISTATVAVTLKKLEKSGYIHRIVQQEDNRFNQICITERGRAVVEKSKEFFQATEKNMFHGFNDEELNELKSYLERLQENLQRQLEEAEREDLL